MAKFHDDQNDDLESPTPNTSEPLPDILQAELRKLDSAIERFFARASLEELQQLSQVFEILKALRKARRN
jgi:hypothetical protein